MKDGNDVVLAMQQAGMTVAEARKVFEDFKRLTGRPLTRVVRGTHRPQLKPLVVAVRRAVMQMEREAKR